MRKSIIRSIQNHKIIRAHQPYQLLFVLVLGALLASCGGRSTLLTKDDSADYRSARALPPLKKPRPQQTEPSQNVNSLPASQSIEQPTDLGTIVESTVAEPQINQAQQNASDELASTSASVVRAKEGTALLVIKQPLDQAWGYMRRSLKGSNVTVHSSNQSAGRILVGCASLEEGDQSGDANNNTSGWSIFSAKPEESEYCTLQLIERGKGSEVTTQVSALTRSGQAASYEAGNALFQRILNN